MDQCVSVKSGFDDIRQLSTVCLPWTNIFLYFHFYVLIVVLLKDMGETFLLSKDEPLTPNIDGVMAL